VAALGFFIDNMRVRQDELELGVRLLCGT
jgi:hypothetical protein